MSPLIACITVPAFWVAVAERQPLISSQAPIVVMSQLNSRGVVIDACPRAVAQGVRRGMSGSDVLACLPRVQFARPDHLIANDLAIAIEQELCQWSDHVERHALGCWFVSLVALGEACHAANAVISNLRRTLDSSPGVETVIGAGTHATIAFVAARLATQHRSQSCIVVYPGTEKAFLAPLPVQILPDVGDKTRRALHHLGIQTIGQLVDVPESVLANALGARGCKLYRMARGLPVPRDVSYQHVLRQQWTWTPDPCRDIQQVQAITYRLTERLGRQLRQQGDAAGRISVDLTWSDGATKHISTPLVPRCDLDSELCDHSHDALMEIISSRRLAVQGIEVAIRDFGPRQASLLSETDRPRHLQHAVDTIRTRHGTGAIVTGNLLALMQRRESA